MAVNTIPNVYWLTLSILNLLKLMNVEKAFSVYTVHWTVYTVTVYSTHKYIYSQYWVLGLKVYKKKQKNAYVECRNGSKKCCQINKIVLKYASVPFRVVQLQEQCQSGVKFSLL